MESLFTKLESEANKKGLKPRSEEARKWFRERIKELGKVNRYNIMRDEKLTSRPRPLPGRMFMFFYDPKHRETLPYYDAFPLILMVGPAEDGFYGLNLHYLEPKLRAVLLDKLTATANNRKYDESTRLKINYQILSSTQNFREFKPCFKHYLSKHVESRVVQVDAPEWDIAIFLPTEQFYKKTKTYVWTESKKIYRKP